jgi:hypothetical protein
MMIQLSGSSCSGGRKAATEPVAQAEGLFIETVFPVPAKDKLTINLTVAEKQVVSLRLLDAAGREAKLIFSGEVEAGTRQFTADVSALQAGIYALQAQSATGLAITKIVLQP